MKSIMALFTVPIAYTLQYHKIPNEVEVNNGTKVMELLVGEVKYNHFV